MTCWYVSIPVFIVGCIFGIWEFEVTARIIVTLAAILIVLGFAEEAFL